MNRSLSLECMSVLMPRGAAPRGTGKPVHSNIDLSAVKKAHPPELWTGVPFS